MGRASRRRAEQRTAAAARATPGSPPGTPAALHPGWPGAEQHGLARLQQLAAEQVAIAALIDDAVLDLAARGVSWGRIGRALGVSRQAARQRYGPRQPSGGA